jgi:hypothetical protein
MGHASAWSGREAGAAASRPLTLVAEAVAGRDLATIAGATARGLGGPVAISVPALGTPVRSPAGPVPEGLEAHARAIAGGHLTPAAADTIVDRGAWLEAAAVAASVAVLLHADHRPLPSAAAVDELLVELAAGPPENPADIVARSRRLGVDLSAGAIALCARCEPMTGPPFEWGPGLLGAECLPGRRLALIPLGPGADERACELASRLQRSGWTVSLSGPRRDAACLHEALREAQLLAQLGSVSGREEIYRLLIGVLLRDSDELERLCARSIAPLADYDERHDTDLLVTLRAFLAHDGSTTETAEAMALHRHTVGYRLSRVYEVSGLSPYESDGRERLGLGIKARQILDVDRQLTETVLAASTRPPAS